MKILRYKVLVTKVQDEEYFGEIIIGRMGFSSTPTLMNERVTLDKLEDQLQNNDQKELLRKNYKLKFVELKILDS